VAARTTSGRGRAAEHTRPELHQQRQSQHGQAAQHVEPDRVRPGLLAQPSQALDRTGRTPAPGWPASASTRCCASFCLQAMRVAADTPRSPRPPSWPYRPASQASCHTGRQSTRHYRLAGYWANSPLSGDARHTPPPYAGHDGRVHIAVGGTGRKRKGRLWQGRDAVRPARWWR